MVIYNIKFLFKKIFPNLYYYLFNKVYKYVIIFNNCY